jgi:AMP deaminase
LYTSFQRCLDLRDKYMTLSRQRLEDNPANYDGAFTAQSSPSYASTSSLLSNNLPPSFKKWQIYPPPPEPHWKERDPHGDPPVETTDEIAEREAQRNRFVLSEVAIPGKEAEGKRRRFALDANGVYQVYSDGKSTGEPASPDAVY